MYRRRGARGGAHRRPRSRVHRADVPRGLQTVAPASGAPPRRVNPWLPLRCARGAWRGELRRGVRRYRPHGPGPPRGRRHVRRQPSSPGWGRGGRIPRPLPAGVEGVRSAWSGRGPRRPAPAARAGTALPRYSTRLHQLLSSRGGPRVHSRQPQRGGGYLRFPPPHMGKRPRRRLLGGPSLGQAWRAARARVPQRARGRRRGRGRRPLPLGGGRAARGGLPRVNGNRCACRRRCGGDLPALL
mmetsp:Transcript_28364/g.90378  ORF Transcript_28364/g.90378 Transcript_28364/m.90378 type:complete len:242 (-) Transcript_28364:910-1635(-)